MGIPVAGILLTTLYYFYLVNSGQKLGTHNNGALINPPLPLQELLLKHDGKEHTWYQPENKWSFVYFGYGQCDKICQDKLYLMRQIRAAMGKYSLRLDNVYINLDPAMTPETASFIKEEHPLLKVLEANEPEVKEWAQKNKLSIDLKKDANFFVADPAGWMMMYYTDEQNYKSVIKDMKFLIKNS